MASSNSQSAGAGSIQYEAFQPISELKEESIANILLVNLPGFQKEQIKVSYVHATRTINVHAEQKLSNGKWRRCYENFPVPQNCKVFEIRGKFQNGTLTITMPKEIITQLQVPPPNKDTEAKIISPKAKLEENTNSPIPPQVANFPSAVDHQTPEKPKQAKTDIPNAQSVQETNSPRFPKKQLDDFTKFPREEKVTSPTSKLSTLDRQAEKRLDDRKIIQEEMHNRAKTDIPNAQSVQETNSPRFPKNQLDDFTKFPRQEKVTSPTSKLSTLDRQAEKTLDGRKMIQKELDKPKYEEKNKPNISDQPAGKPKSGNEMGHKKSSSAEIENEIKDDHRARSRDREEKSLASTVKEAVQEFAMEMNEERKAMVNMGVAVLVLAAFGAYIGYSIGSSSGKSKD